MRYQNEYVEDEITIDKIMILFGRENNECNQSVEVRFIIHKTIFNN